MTETASNEKKNKRRIIIILLLLLLLILLLLFLRFRKQTYSIVFKDNDGTILEVQEVKKGELPVFKGVLESKTNAEEKYTFVSWDKPIVEAVKDEIYTAVYRKTYIFSSGGNNEPSSVGETIDYYPEENIENPVVENEQHTYYWVNFFDSDGTLLERKSVISGQMPSFSGPVSGSNREDFLGWSPELHVVSGTQNYMATYDVQHVQQESVPQEEPQPAPQQYVNVYYCDASLFYDVYWEDDYWGNLDEVKCVTLPVGTTITLSAKANAQNMMFPNLALPFSQANYFYTDSSSIPYIDQFWNSYDHFTGKYSNGNSTMQIELQPDTDVYLCPTFENPTAYLDYVSLIEVVPDSGWQIDVKNNTDYIGWVSYGSLEDEYTFDAYTFDAVNNIFYCQYLMDSPVHS